MLRDAFKVQLHNKLCEVANVLLHYYNPCRIENGKCRNESYPKTCCGIPNTIFSVKGLDKCPFLGPSGCTIQSLECKLYLCDQAIKECPELAEDLGHLKKMAKQYGYMA